jgi:hypothetical protein
MRGWMSRNPLHLSGYSGRLIGPLLKEPILSQDKNIAIAQRLLDRRGREPDAIAAVFAENLRFEILVDRVWHERQMFRSHQKPFLPRAILTDAVGSCEHHAATAHTSPG